MPISQGIQRLEGMDIWRLVECAMYLSDAIKVPVCFMGREERRANPRKLVVVIMATLQVRYIQLVNFVITTISMLRRVSLGEVREPCMCLIM